MTQAQKNQVERAMELAKKAGHKVYTGHSRQTNETIYTVKSRSQENTFHVLYIRDGRIHCDCEAHKQGRICSHAGAVRLFLIEQREALKSIEARDETERQEPERDSRPSRLMSSLDRRETALPAQMTAPERASVDGLPGYLFR